jgi:hypothetical protein
MKNNIILNYLNKVLENMPKAWLNLTTHRLDIYDEKLAKTEFLEQFKLLCNKNIADISALDNLPTAYDYIRLGHPLSCILEWAIAHLHDTKPENIMSFSSQTIPVLAILRKNLLVHKNTQIVFTGKLPVMFDAEVIKQTYGYQFELKHIEKSSDIPDFEGSTIFISQGEAISVNPINSTIDFFVNIYKQLGSVLVVNGEQNEHYISEIQHVRRRETIAMTPVNCYTALHALVKNSRFPVSLSNLEIN